MSEDSRKPKANVSKELEKAAEQFDKFDENIKSMTMDRMNKAPKLETEGQTKMSSNEISNSTDVYLKPIRSIYAVDAKTGKGQQFNEKFRANWEFDKEYVLFIAENKEAPGDIIDIWTRPYGGLPAEEWKVPTNKPVWGPRYLAEQIKSKCYHRLKMENTVITESNHVGQMYGALAVDTTVQRLDANPVSKKKSIFMGANNF